jgi:hypothetical protein
MPDRARRSSGLENGAERASPPINRWELPTRAEWSRLPREREPRVQATVQSSSIRRPAANDDMNGILGRSELPVELTCQPEAPGERRQVSLQPPSPNLTNRAREPGPDTIPNVRSGTTYQDELRRRRRRVNMDPQLDELITNRVYELPASTQRSRKSQRLVRERGPLSDLEWSLNSRHRRSAFHGYASEEDVSQPGSSMVGE